jgi:hypothetical protein
MELEGGSVDLGLIVTDIKNGKRAEKVLQAEIEKWLTDKVPTIYAAHRQQEQFSSSTIGFEFWTCGSFDEDSLQLLAEAKKAARKYTIDWKTGADVRSYVQSLSAPGLKRIPNDFNLSIAVFGRNTGQGNGAADSQQPEILSVSSETHL